MVDFSNLSLSVFFPAHNEVESLRSLIEKAVEVISNLIDDFEIIIVNDGSTDGTAELAESLCKEYQQVRVIHHEQNRGYGSALQSGFRHAVKDLVFYTDADAQFDLRDLKDILPLIEDSDVVTCYRQDRCDPWHRSLNTWLFEQAVFLLFGLEVRDPDCAFKIYRKELIDSMDLTSEGAMIDVEMLLQAQRKGYRIVQSSVKHYPRKAGTPSGGNPLVIFKAMGEMYQLWLRLGSRFNLRRKS